MRNKCYVKFNDLRAWASRVSKKEGYGHMNQYMRAIFQPIVPIFDGSQSYVDPADGQIKSYPAIVTDAQLYFYYLDQFGERYCYCPVEVGKLNPSNDTIMDYDAAMYEVFIKMERQISHFCQFNKLKYYNLLQTLQYEYNPIENYNMVENGTDDREYNGEETSDHNVNANKLGGYEINGPLSDATIGKDEEGNPIIDIVFDATKKIKTTDHSVSDTQAGKKAAGTADSPSVGSGDAVKTKNFTTTYDEDKEGKLESYTTTEGSNASESKGISETDMPLTGKAYSGAPGHPSYTDTKSFNGRADNGKHHLTRTGNIGVTTTQQMIEQEREKARINILDEFFNELNSKILLDVY